MKARENDKGLLKNYLHDEDCNSSDREKDSALVERILDTSKNGETESYEDVESALSDFKARVGREDKSNTMAICS